MVPGIVTRIVSRIIIYVITGFIFITALFPIYWIVSSSFKKTADIVTSVPKFIFTPTLEHVAAIFARGPYVSGLINSLIVSSCALTLGLALGVPAAYGLARLNFQRKKDVEFWFMSMRFLPPIAVIIPYYAIWVALQLYDTYTALIVTYSIATLPIVVLLMTQYFKAMPIETEEASMLDGCSQYQSFYRIALPNVMPALISTATFAFVLLWNEFFFAFVLTSRQSLTIPVVVAAFATITWEIPWGQICAAASLLMIPPLILAAVFRKALVSFFLTGK
jgi:multiple sugar transport system permease protein